MRCEESLDVTAHTATGTMRLFAIEHAHPEVWRERLDYVPESLYE